MMPIHSRRRYADAVIIRKGEASVERYVWEPLSQLSKTGLPANRVGGEAFNTLDEHRSTGNSRVVVGKTAAISNRGSAYRPISSATIHF